MDQGLTPDRYQLIPRVLIFVTYGEEVLLIKGAPHKRLWANLYNGVGGHVERGEDLLSAARRELAEETGLLPAHLAPPGLWLCGTLIVDTGQPTGVGLSIFRAILASSSLPQMDKTSIWGRPELLPQIQKFGGGGEGALEWIHPSRLPALPCLPDLPLLLPRCLAHTPAEPPFFGLSQTGPQGEVILTYS